MILDDRFIALIDDTQYQFHFIKQCSIQNPYYTVAISFLTKQKTWVELLQTEIIFTDKVWQFKNQNLPLKLILLEPTIHQYLQLTETKGNSDS